MSVDYPDLTPHQHQFDPSALDPPALAPPLDGGLRYEDLAARAAGGVAVDGEIVATAMQLMKHGEAVDMSLPDGSSALAKRAADEDPEEEPAFDADGKRKKKRVKKLALSSHEALTLFSHRGIYVDEETGELRASSNHKRCDKWDMYNYTRHFTFKVYKKYEASLLHTEVEQRRLLHAKERFFVVHPMGEEPALFRRKRRVARESRKVLTPDQLRVQERHWLEMWQGAKNELKVLRDDLRDEMDEMVRAEHAADIAGLKRRKGDWARLLGLDTTAVPE